MIVLHALWDVLNSELCVWGESRNLFRPLLRPKDTTKKGQSVGFHPFAVKPRYLKILTTVKLRMRLVGNIGQRVVDLRLPSARGIPLPSPAILTSLPDDKLCSWCEETKVRFRTWEVGVLALGGESVLEFLSLLPENPPEGTTYGEDLLFWKNLFKRAVDTVKCRRFVPSVAVGTNNGRFLHAAIWEPIFDYEDNCLLGELSTSMPNACLAFADSDHEEISPLQAVFSFFNWCVDSFIRHSVKEYLPIEETLKHLKGQRVHEQWLKALLRDDPTLSGTDAALSDFDSRIMEWVKKLIESISGANSASSLIQSHFRLCLKLEPLTEEIRMSTDDCCGAEPNVGSGVENRALVARKWRLTYYLQAEDDPSLLIPAEDIWWAQAASTVRRALVSQHREWDQGAKKATNGPTDRGTYQAADAASHRGAYLDEVLLRELAKASRVFRGIEETLKEPCPTGLVLDADELEEFLRKTAPALIEKGIELMLPPWWQKPPAKIRARLRVKEDSSPTTGLLGISSIVNYDWEIAVDDKSLTVEEFLRLARTKLHLVKVRGEWVRFDPNEVDRALEFFGRRSSGKIRLGEVLSLSLGGEVPGTNIPIEEVRAEGRINDILSTLSSLNGELRMSLQPIPEGFSGQLRPYQTRGFRGLSF